MTLHQGVHDRQIIRIHRDYLAKNIGHRGPKEKTEKEREKPGTKYLIFLFNLGLNKQHRSSLVLKD